jgi:hypothetical protein
VLRPHRSQRVRLRLTDRDLSFWDVNRHGRRIAPGRYRLQVGFSSRHLRHAGTLSR